MDERAWFLVVAIVGGAVSAFKAFAGFGVETKGRPLAWWIHQVWFNFAGFFFGWAATWILGRRLWPCMWGQCGALSWSDAALGLVALVGITGHLPLVTMGLVQGIVDLAKDLLKLVVKKGA